MIQNMFEDRVKRVSDINEHLCTLRDLANQCESVTEFGMREGNSTIAFLASTTKKVISYDIQDYQFGHELGVSFPGRFTFICQDTAKKFNIAPTDMLFIDTLHTYDQVKQELLKACQVRKFIAFHDTVLFGKDGEQGQEGINRAIEEFMADNKEWEIMADYKNNNGLLVLKHV